MVYIYNETYEISKLLFNWIFNFFKLWLECLCSKLSLIPVDKLTMFDLEYKPTVIGEFSKMIG